MPDASLPGARPRALLAAAAAILFAWTAATSVTRVFRDAPTWDAPTGGTHELEADNYCSPPRQRLHGVPLDAPQAVYVVHAPLQALAALAMGAADPEHVHRAVREGTLALHALLAAGVTLLAFRRWRGRGALWPWALVACWTLSPGLWGLARLAYSEHYVGLALALALATTPAPGAGALRVLLGGAGLGVLLASKFYGALPLALLSAALAREDLARRRAPWRALALAAAACATAALLWAAAGAAYGLDPVAALREHWAGVGSHRQRMGMGWTDVVLGLPRALAAGLPGWGWEWIVALLCLRQAALAGAVDPRRFLVWSTCVVVPWVLSPWPYRLWPLLLALPLLAPRPRPDARGTAPQRWAAVVLETLVLGNVLRRAYPGLLHHRSRALAVAGLAAVLAARAAGRTAAGRALRAWASRRETPVLAAACAVVALAGAAWQTRDWASPEWTFDDSARRLAARAPDDASVAGVLPELWCRYLPRARCLPTEVALEVVPPETALTSDVVVLPDPATGGAWYEAYLEGTTRRYEPIHWFMGREGRVVIGVRRPR